MELSAMTVECEQFIYLILLANQDQQESKTLWPYILAYCLNKLCLALTEENHVQWH